MIRGIFHKSNPSVSMKASVVPSAILSLVIAVSVLPSVCSGGFQRIDDFDDRPLGPIDPQPDWFATSSSTVVGTDPTDQQNQTLAFRTNSTILHRTLFVPDREAHMLFFRFRFSDQQNFSVGLSQLSSPDEFSDFGPEIGMASATHDLRVWEGGVGHYVDLVRLQPEKWYNVWVFVDTGSDNFRIYLHDRSGEAATSADQLSTSGDLTFGFRSGFGDLQKFYIKTGGGQGGMGAKDGPVLIDDIYLDHENGVLNLQNPTGPDVVAYGVVKERSYLQMESAPTIDPEEAYGILAFVEPVAGDSVLEASVSLPGGESFPLMRSSRDETMFVAETAFASRSELDAFAPNGDYTLSVRTRNDGEKQLTLALTSDANSFPAVPTFTPATLQATRAWAAETSGELAWEPWSAANPGDTILVTIDSTVTEAAVFSSPAPWSGQSLDGSATSFAIPAAALVPGQAYFARTTFVHLDGEDASSYPGAVGLVGHLSSTDTWLLTSITYAQWLEQVFDPEQLTDVEIVGPDKDPEKDGVVNLFEYAAATDPLVRDRTDAELKTWLTGGDVNLLGRARTTATDLTFALEQSLDLVDWSMVTGADPIGIWEDRGVWQLSHYALPRNPDPVRFYRWKVRLAP